MGLLLNTFVYRGLNGTKRTVIRSITVIDKEILFLLISISDFRFSAKYVALIIVRTGIYPDFKCWGDQRLSVAAYT
ncbi:Hypothetical protein NTJ_11420 [Nesidiocoris tenuis]|uniref:G-protein coupled receptors family 1 profile domain-containing protein n=1 Tax=Nesidiocoris tenuis TaxID=355587 RepID=A0ABN7B2F5_9HEMI|nr:Hypothetical protein NTJ_11420 [Nesidiocoris tenuis]